MFYCPISIYSCPIPLTFSKLMFDLPYFVSDSSYGYQSDLHDDNFVRRKQRRNRTTFTVQQVKEKKKEHFLEHFICFQPPFSTVKFEFLTFILYFAPEQNFLSAESLKIAFCELATHVREHR